MHAGAAVEGKSFNFIIFLNEDKSYQFDPIMFGDFPGFISQMKTSKLLLLSHNPGVIGGDVINLQQDMLRSTGGDRFSDAGINCQLSLASEAESYHLAGNCQIIDKFHGKQLTLRAKVTDTELPDITEGRPVWIEVYEDARTGIAFYANIGNR
ncbi:hypothetical protein [Mariprofundus micogutta]|uniref:hypothetical protein n=1 Tax=Mariprofundus micogutta TaxID=1921010 RepID=UPI001D0F7123|nr:hypothetical protein [Mariprofundus micogutta]